LYMSSPDGGDSFPTSVRVNEAPHAVAAHGELARSTDWGGKFSKPIVVDSGSESQGFYTMSVSPKGNVYVAWLDGRERGGEGSGLYMARSTDCGVRRSTRVFGWHPVFARAVGPR